MNRWKFNDLKSQHFACVYKLVFPNGKIYVGKSKDIGKRMGLYERKTEGKWSDGDSTAVMGAMRLYGCESVEIEVLFKLSVAYGVDWEKDLDYALGIVEMRWIKELSSNSPDVGYNGTEGGEMFGIREMERVKEVEKTRIVYKDVVVERERQTNGVPVVGYDINGNYIGEWPSRIAFTKEVVGLKQTMDYGEWKRGYIMYEKTDNVVDRVESYAEYIERTSAAEIEAKRVLEEKVGKMKVYRETKLKDSIVLVGKNGEEVARYDSLRDAAEMSSVSYSSLYSCLRKGWGTAGGFRVFHADEWDESHEECLKRSMKTRVADNASDDDGVGVRRHKASKYGTVYQYDRYFREVGRYITMQEASQKTGIVVSSIYQALKKGGNSFAGGYHWRFESDRILDGQSENPTQTTVGLEEKSESEQSQTTLFDGFSSEDL